MTDGSPAESLLICIAVLRSIACGFGDGTSCGEETRNSSGSHVASLFGERKRVPEAKPSIVCLTRLHVYAAEGNDEAVPRRLTCVLLSKPKTDRFRSCWCFVRHPITVHARALASPVWNHVNSYYITSSMACMVDSSILRLDASHSHINSV